jgi:hypothetical protein
MCVYMCVHVCMCVYVCVYVCLSVCMSVGGCGWVDRGWESVGGWTGGGGGGGPYCLCTDKPVCLYKDIKVRAGANRAHDLTKEHQVCVNTAMVP